MDMDARIRHVQEILAREETQEELRAFHRFLVHRGAIGPEHDETTCADCLEGHVPAEVAGPGIEGHSPP